jgi:hypothetical protein
MFIYLYGIACMLFLCFVSRLFQSTDRPLWVDVMYSLFWFLTSPLIVLMYFTDKGELWTQRKSKS